MQWFQNLNLRIKLSLSFLPIGLIALALASVGYYGINQMSTQTQLSLLLPPTHRSFPRIGPFHFNPYGASALSTS